MLLKLAIHYRDSDVAFSFLFFSFLNMLLQLQESFSKLYYVLLSNFRDTPSLAFMKLRSNRSKAFDWQALLSESKSKKTNVEKMVKKIWLLFWLQMTEHPNTSTETILETKLKNKERHLNILSDGDRINLESISDSWLKGFEMVVIYCKLWIAVNSTDVYCIFFPNGYKPTVHLQWELC